MAGLALGDDMVYRINYLRVHIIVASEETLTILGRSQFLTVLDVCRCGPRLLAMPSNFLNTVTNRHNYDKMSPLELAAEAQKPTSINRSINRRSKFLTPGQIDLLKQLGESRHVWFQLRRHGTKQHVEEWLKAAVTQSNWLHDRESEEETLRREYLRLYQEIQWYDPDFVHDEMVARRQQGTTQNQDDSDRIDA